MSFTELLQPIQQFLQCETPDSWLMEAQKPERLAVLLQDHLICELKAAQTAMYLLRRYACDKDSSVTLLNWLKPFEDFAYRFDGDIQSLKQAEKLTKSIIGRSDFAYSDRIIDRMVLLIREELHHFCQVLDIMQARGIPYENISASRYAKTLIQNCKTHEPQILIDKLICGAYIEARSCERFARLAEFVDPELASFYTSLLRSEARHFADYLELAQVISKSDITERVRFFGQLEAELILTADPDFKFHSGAPVTTI
ncbi:tRNA-(ms[2]io[6]A)-hydroxylase [Rheinheimera mesophila]|uniref:tRNA-(Ms[2]io[6]A)-hydroxylase n=1 Tax=Rheinheimera mesophila TaxID=1547515 RepID=A0A3P3QEK1_9GAMM|nr:tRNA isopentenyl-2-thiomethyl-A-37 hydroxylase MiaE [Rheinheimera mesophila]KKL00584.1 tRNA hydroxylase [Rheinheimera mesophila]RRJ19637.1 tRNA-(ms[2]io[6]A)-hydroxylase [Rheinheimera mesophila]